MELVIAGEDVTIENNHAILFNGSYHVCYRKGTTVDEIKADLEKNMNEYRNDDHISFCKANGFYD